MKRLHNLSILLVLVLIYGCCGGVTTKAQLERPWHHYAPTQELEILVSKPSQPHKTIGTLDSKGCPGTNHYSTFADVREKAMELGANAIVISKAGVHNCSFKCTCPYLDVEALRFKEQKQKSKEIVENACWY